MFWRTVFDKPSTSSQLRIGFGHFPPLIRMSLSSRKILQSRSLISSLDFVKYSLRCTKFLIEVSIRLWAWEFSPATCFFYNSWSTPPTNPLPKSNCGSFLFLYSGLISIDVSSAASQSSLNTCLNLSPDLCTNFFGLWRPRWLLFMTSISSFYNMNLDSCLWFSALSLCLS